MKPGKNWVCTKFFPLNPLNYLNRLEGRFINLEYNWNGKLFVQMKIDKFVDVSQNNLEITFKSGNPDRGFRQKYVSLRLRVQNWTTKWHFPLNFWTVAYPGLLLKGPSFSCYRMEISELPTFSCYRMEISKLPNHADLLVLCMIMSK